ncbi:MAG TPA: hypothetical protein VIK45_10605 [Candidatus Dormibacteraeota bacterium]
MGQQHGSFQKSDSTTSRAHYIGTVPPGPGVLGVLVAAQRRRVQVPEWVIYHVTQPNPGTVYLKFGHAA